VRGYVRVVWRIHHVLVVVLGFLVVDGLPVLDHVGVFVQIVDHHLVVGVAVDIGSLHHHGLVHHLGVLLNDFDVGRVDFHVWRSVVEHCGWHVGHGVSQLAQLVISVREAAVDAKLAVAVRLEVLAVLGLVVAMQHANELLAREGLGERLKQNHR
jgi:hypothetical protein